MPYLVYIEEIASLLCSKNCEFSIPRFSLERSCKLIHTASEMVCGFIIHSSEVNNTIFYAYFYNEENDNLKYQRQLLVVTQVEEHVDSLKKRHGMFVVIFSSHLTSLYLFI